MARYEVFIPAADAEGMSVTLRVTADTWMAALKAGLKKVGDTGGLASNVLCDVQDDDSIHVTDARGRVFRIAQIPEVSDPGLAARMPPSPWMAPTTAPPPGAPPAEDPRVVQLRAAHEKALAEVKAAAEARIAAEKKAAAEARAFAERLAAEKAALEKLLEQRAAAELKAHQEEQAAQDRARKAEQAQAEAKAAAERAVVEAKAAADARVAAKKAADERAALEKATEEKRKVAERVEAEKQAAARAAQDRADAEQAARARAEKVAAEKAAAEAAARARRDTPEEAAERAAVERELAERAAAKKPVTGKGLARRARTDADADKIVQVAQPKTKVSGSIGRDDAADAAGVEEVLADLFERSPEVFHKPSDEGLYFLLDLAMEKIPCESGSVYVADLNRQDLAFAAVRGPKAREVLDLKLRVPMGKGFVGFCAQEGVAVAISDVQKDPRFHAEVSQRLGYETKSLLTTPILIHGRTWGALQLINKKGSSAFTHAELSILHYLAHQAALYLESVEGT